MTVNFGAVRAMNLVEHIFARIFPNFHKAVAARSPQNRYAPPRNRKVFLQWTSSCVHRRLARNQGS